MVMGIVQMSNNDPGEFVGDAFAKLTAASQIIPGKQQPGRAGLLRVTFGDDLVEARFDAFPVIGAESREPGRGQTAQAVALALRKLGSRQPEPGPGVAFEGFPVPAGFFPHLDSEIALVAHGVQGAQIVQMRNRPAPADAADANGALAGIYEQVQGFVEHRFGFVLRGELGEVAQAARKPSCDMG